MPRRRARDGGGGAGQLQAILHEALPDWPEGALLSLVAAHDPQRVIRERTFRRLGCVAQMISEMFGRNRRR